MVRLLHPTECETRVTAGGVVLPEPLMSRSRSSAGGCGNNARTPTISIATYVR